MGDRTTQEKLPQTPIAVTPGGSDTYVQYNNGGVFGGDGNFTWDKNNQIFTVIGGDRNNSNINTGNSQVRLGDYDGNSNGTYFIIDDNAGEIDASAPIVAPLFVGPLNGNASTATFATSAGSATTATTATQANQLTNTRTIWGQNFNGTANVTGSLTAVQDITGGASNMIITAGTGNSRTLTLRTTTAAGAATNGLIINATQDTQARTFNAGFSTQPSATDTRYFYLFASGSFTTNTKGMEASIRNSSSTQSGIYGADFTATQVTNNAASGVLYGGKFTGEALANVQTNYGFYAQYTTGSGAIVQDGGATLVQMNNVGETVNFRGLYLNMINGANISGSMIANYVKYQHQNGASTLPSFTGMKVELVNGTQTITTARGIAFEGYSNAGTITTNYLIYADTNAAQGTNKWGIYFDANMPSYHLGKFGLGTSITAPTARLHIAAGTATANTAPLKFNSGTLLTTAEAGAVEFLTDDFFLTITTGAARKGIVLDNGARLTSGKIPIATTNGRLIDGQTPLTGTKVYYVSDTSGGAVTRKLTFIDGILTSET